MIVLVVTLIWIALCFGFLAILHTCTQAKGIALAGSRLIADDGHVAQNQNDRDQRLAA
jgi:hypothetical protein